MNLVIPCTGKNLSNHRARWGYSSIPRSAPHGVTKDPFWNQWLVICQYGMIYLGECRWEGSSTLSVWDITWLSADACHLDKCLRSKSEICHILLILSQLVRKLDQVHDSHLFKCTDWSLIQVTSRTVYAAITGAWIAMVKSTILLPECKSIHIHDIAASSAL